MENFLWETWGDTKRSDHLSLCALVLWKVDLVCPRPCTATVSGLCFFLEWTLQLKGCCMFHVDINHCQINCEISINEQDHHQDGQLLTFLHCPFIHPSINTSISHQTCRTKPYKVNSYSTSYRHWTAPKAAYFPYTHKHISRFVTCWLDTSALSRPSTQSAPLWMFFLHQASSVSRWPSLENTSQSSKVGTPVLPAGDLTKLQTCTSFKYHPNTYTLHQYRLTKHALADCNITADTRIDYLSMLCRPFPS